MDRLNELLQELGISKVRLAKYLGVSRQMVYNYLELKNINKWPKEKKILLYRLLDIEDGSDETLDNIKVNTEYLMDVEQRLNQCVKENNGIDSFIDIKGLKKEEQELLSDIIYLIKEKFTEDSKSSKENYYIFLYLYHLLQALDTNPEIKYILGYISKTTGYTNPKEFKFNEEKQILLEGILHSAMTLYHSGGASKSKILEYHNKYVQELEQKREEKLQLGRTQQLNTLKIQALNELGYTEFNNENYHEVLEKMDEIEARNKNK